MTLLAETAASSLLDRISDPRDLRLMAPAELEALAGEIREFLVASLSGTGGHLGPNLGVVELTIALHRVFASPRDAIIWDTGHQAYVHKLVTGRRDGFGRLRKEGGLSGYPSRAESPHDLVENSHASTALSYAYGMVRAGLLAGDLRRVVAVVGDGALTGGLAYEALNNIGASGAPVVIVLNDNGRSYAPTVSRLTTAARPGAPEGRPEAFFESLGIDYLGPADGHDIAAVEELLSRAAAHAGPVVVHVHTVKGRGYAPAELDDEKRLHDVASFDPSTGRPPAGARRRLSCTEAFGAALLREAEMRPELVAITAAMAGPTGLLDFAKRHPDRLFDVGIAEQHAVAAAAGMATAGLRPVVAIYSTFLNRAWDQVVHDVALHRLPVVFCLDRAGVTGDDGPSHHGIFDMVLLSKVPGMTVLAPSSYEEIGVMLHEALEITTGPVAIRWPKSEPRSCAEVGTGLRARLVRAGDGVALVGVGKLLEACEEAARLLEAAGLDCAVYDMRAVSPVDPWLVSELARRDVVVVAEDGIAEGGAGSALESAVQSAVQSAGAGRGPRVVRRGVPIAFIPHGDAAGILRRLGLDGPGLTDTVLRAVGTRTR